MLHGFLRFVVARGHSSHLRFADRQVKLDPIEDLYDILVGLFEHLVLLI
jgi:hypothetical protein